MTERDLNPESVDQPTIPVPDAEDTLDASAPETTPEEVIEALADASAETEPERTSRDVLYESIGLQLVAAGVFTPAREFIDQVRAAAGTRVSPREIAATVTQMAQSGAEVTPESVAGIARSASGDRSQRQQRNADEWRELGAALTLRGMDGSADGQRTFVGAARRLAGRDATDVLVLRIALALAELDAALDPETVGKLGKRLATSAPDIPPDSFTEIVNSELRNLNRAERAAALTKRKSRSSSAARRKPSTYLHNPGARKLRPGRRKKKRGMT